MCVEPHRPRGEWNDACVLIFWKRNEKVELGLTFAIITYIKKSLHFHPGAFSPKEKEWCWQGLCVFIMGEKKNKETQVIIVWNSFSQLFSQTNWPKSRVVETQAPVNFTIKMSVLLKSKSFLSMVSLDRFKLLGNRKPMFCDCKASWLYSWGN